MKSRASKLDQYAATLLSMDGEKKTLADMQAWLKQEGPPRGETSPKARCTVSAGALSNWLSSARQRALQDRLLGQIASGARQCADVEKQFGKNPAPELETLIKLHRVLILQLSTQGNANPEFLTLADQLMRTAMEFVSAQTKAKLESQKLGIQERRVKLLEKKAAQSEATEKVLDDKKLSPEQRAQRIKEIYGR